jgi:hypothetical protein
MPPRAPRRPFVFPDPANVAPAQPAVICTAERVLDLYRQSTGVTRVRVVQSVKDWFTQAARENGWEGVTFLRDFQTEHTAGCVMWRPAEIQATVNVTKITKITLTSDAPAATGKPAKG